MALGAKTNLGFKAGNPAVGTGASSIGGKMFVLNENAAAVDADPDNPYADNGTDVRPAIVPSMGLQLEMYVCWEAVDTTGIATSLSTAPEVYVYGKVPDNGQGKLWPQDIASSQFKDLAADAVNPGFWIPLTNTDAAYTVGTVDDETDTGDYVQFPATGAVVSGDSWAMSRRVPVYLAGCTEVIVLVKKAAAGTQLDAAMIVGRFVG